MKPTKEIIEMFEKDRFATGNGAIIEEVADRYAKCSLKLGKSIATRSER